jgi:hypothetical protein
MNRSLWIKGIDKTYCPGWQCPSCTEGTIVLVPKSLAHAETILSVQGHDHSDFDPDWIQYSFTAWGQCSHASCQQKFAIAGKGGVSPEFTSDGRSWEYEDYFEPQYCFPMPHIIELPQKCPNNIKKELIAAFSLFWLNRPACAGRIRVSLEMLMDHMSVPNKRKAKNGRDLELTLHERIDAYSAKDPQFGSYLMALKWLGNTGSHEGDISKADILDAFEILEHALVEILDNRNEKVAELAKKLHEKHGRKKSCKADDL